MSGMFWIALELSIPKIGFNFILSFIIKKLDAFKFDGVAESDNTAYYRKATTHVSSICEPPFTLGAKQLGV